VKGNINIYMGGCISYFHCNNEYNKATAWRVKLAQKLLDLNAKLCDNHFDWFDPTINFEDNIHTANVRTVVQQNNHYLDKCDIMVVNLEQLDNSPGTIYEIVYYTIKNKPIIAFNYNKLIHSPHISIGITEKLDTLDDVVEYLHSYYAQ
jgi:nucleoside 2-deoxyribosyltransferase